MISAFIERARSSAGTTERDTQALAEAATWLSGRVDGQGDQLTAQAQSLQVVEAKANDATAAFLAKVAAIAGPSSSIRFAYQFRLQTTHGYQDAGWYVDLSSNGPATVVFDFARFIITDGTTKSAPFRFENGVLFLGALVAGNVVVGGTLTAHHIQSNSITRVFSASNPSAGAIGGAWSDFININIDRVHTAKVVHQLTFNAGMSGVAQIASVDVRILADGAVIAQRRITQVPVSGNARMNATVVANHVQSGDGVQSIAVQFSKAGGETTSIFDVSMISSVLVR